MGRVFQTEPPVAGLNARDAVDGLQPNEAIRLINWIPDVGFMRSRRGTVEIADIEVANSVETVISYEVADADDDQLLAVAGGSLYDVTDNTAIVQTTIPTDPLPTSRLHHAIFVDLNGDAQLILTGAFENDDAITPIIYDAATQTAVAIDTTGSAAELDVTNLFTPLVFKGRVIYGDRSQLAMWYAQAGAFQGVLTKFPLGSVFQNGGKIKHVFTWSKDTGDGMDDMLGIMTTTGETLIYQGDDPDDSLGWELIQRYNLPRPLNARMERLGAEMLYISEDGYVNLAQAIAEGPVSDYGLFSGRIARLVKDAVRENRDKFGWAIKFYPRGNLVLVNIPVQDDQEYEQHVLNTRTGAWTTFRSINAISMTIHSGNLVYGGAEGKLYRADTGTSDLGEAIVCDCVTAYTTLGYPQGSKNATAMTVIHNHAQPKAFNLDALSEFANIEGARPPMRFVTENSIGQWNVSNWDEDYWGKDERPEGGIRYRRPVRANGYNIAFSVRQASRVQVVYWFSSVLEFRIAGRK